MKNKSEKTSPTPEAKALSLFLMAYKTISPVYKEKSKQVNRLYDQVKMGQLTKVKYDEEVRAILKGYGGYAEVVEKTVKYYIKKTGEWTLKGTDQYCMDAKEVADRLLKKAEE